MAKIDPGVATIGAAVIAGAVAIIGLFISNELNHGQGAPPAATSTSTTSQSPAAPSGPVSLLGVQPASTENGTLEALPQNVGGVSYPNTLTGTTGCGDLKATYPLDGKHGAFTAKIGIATASQEPSTSSTVVTTILLDGNAVKTITLSAQGGPPALVSVPLGSAQSLSLTFSAQACDKWAVVVIDPLLTN